MITFLILLSALVSAQANQIDIDKINFLNLLGDNSSIDESNETPVDRIWGGVNVVEDQRRLYAHQVRLISQDELSPTTFGCGGSIISARCVLTAAHCLWGFKFDRRQQRDVEYDAIYTDVFFGIHHLRDVNNPNTVSRRVWRDHRILHERWLPNFGSLLNDIALLRLTIPVIININNIAIASISLPTQQTCANRVVDDDAIISGWGEIANNRDTMDLKFATTTVQPDEECIVRYLNNYVRNQQICSIGRRFEKTCQGDSGGPMVYRDEDLNQEIIGITSYGTQFCEAAHPTVFTSVCAYLNWINPHFNRITAALEVNGEVVYENN